METRKINSAYLYGLLLKKNDPNSLKEFFYHIKRDSNNLSRRYAKKSLFFSILTEQHSDDVIEGVIKEIKDQREYSKFDPMKELDALHIWVTTRGPRYNEVLWVSVMSLFTVHKCDSFGGRLEYSYRPYVLENNYYFDAVCHSLRTSDGWFDFIELVGDAGCEKIIHHAPITCREGFSECCIPVITTKNASNCSHEVLLRLSFVTLHSETIRLFPKEELKKNLYSIIQDDDDLKLLSFFRAYKGDLEFVETLYERICELEDPLLDTLCRMLRDECLFHPYKHAGNQMYYVFKVDKRNGVVYKEKDYIIVMLKMSGHKYETDNVFKEWYKHYGCRGTSMTIEQELVLAMACTARADKSGVWYRNVPVQEDGSLDMEQYNKEEKIDIGICLLKGYITNTRLLRLLLLHGLIDLTLYSGENHDPRLAVRRRDHSPLFKLIETGDNVRKGVKKAAPKLDF